VYGLIERPLTARPRSRESTSISRDDSGEPGLGRIETMRAISNNANLERLIAEVRSADEVGVFARSQVDVAALAASPAPSRLVMFYERALVVLPLAACLAVVIGIASLAGNPMDAGLSQTPIASVAPGISPGVDLVASCLSGPGAHVSDTCSVADFDGDGDVDMLDMSSYQRMVASIN
jgi:hypothetical protein